VSENDEQFERRLGEDLSRLAARAGGGPAPGRVLKRLEVRTLRRRVGAAGALAAAIVTAAAVMTLSSGPRVKTQEVAGAEEAALRAEIARLQAEAEWRTDVVRHMLALERQRRLDEELRRQLARPDPAEQIVRDVEEVAFVIVHDADRVRQEEGGLESAVAAYRQVVRLFPRTRWANVARKRLADIDKS